MLPLQPIINNLPSPADPLTTWLTFIGVIAVAGIAAWSLAASDKRKFNQENIRRWDADLVTTATEMLVITDDVASSKKQEEGKIRAIRDAEFPKVLQSQMTKIRLLSNERIGDLCQNTVKEYMKYRFALMYRMKDLEEANKKIDSADLGDGLSLNSTGGDEYWEARTTFHDALHELVVSREVREAGMPKEIDWRELLAIAYGKGRIGGSGYTRVTYSVPRITTETESVSGDVPIEVPADNSEKNGDLENKP